MAVKKELNKNVILRDLKAMTKRLADESKLESDADYAKLQLTWNHDILDRSLNYMPRESLKVMGIGSFLGTVEMALAPYNHEVTCVDFKSFLPKWKPKNVKFHKANVDSGDWKLPSIPNERYDAIYFIETIEHLLWSPLPLLKWMQQNAHMVVISTPDDVEWPPMEVHPWTRYSSYKDIPTAAPGAKSNPLPMFHTKQYTQAELIEMLDFVGFRVNEFFRTGDGHHQMVAILQPR